MPNPARSRRIKAPASVPPIRPTIIQTMICARLNVMNLHHVDLLVDHDIVQLG